MDDKPIESTEAGRSFTDTFKNILSSVLKTDLGQVLKNRGDRLGKFEDSSVGEAGTRSPEIKALDNATLATRSSKAKSPTTRASDTSKSSAKNPVSKSPPAYSSEVRNYAVKSPGSPKTRNPNARSPDVQEKSPSTRNSEGKIPSMRSSETRNERSSAVETIGRISPVLSGPETRSPSRRSPDMNTSDTRTPGTCSPQTTKPSQEEKRSEVSDTNLETRGTRTQVTTFPQSTNPERINAESRTVDTRRNSPEMRAPGNSGSSPMNQITDVKPALLVPKNKARKSLPKPMSSTNECDTFPKGPKICLEDKSPSTHFTKTGKRKMKKFKGGTYHLSIKPKKQKRRRMAGQDQLDAVSNSTGDTLCDDQTSPEELASESEMGSELSSSKTGPSSRATVSPSTSEISEFHLEMSASSRASVSMVGDDDSGLDAADEPDLESERNVMLTEENRQLDEPQLFQTETSHEKQRASIALDKSQQILEKSQEEEASVALSVKRRRILQQRKGDGDDLESVASSWSTGSDQPIPKRARKGGGVPLPSLTGSKQDLLKRWFHKCTCREESETPGERLKEIYCQAVDCIDERLIGCCNIVTKPFLNRPARKIPFGWMCDMHRFRLRAHQCCPGCGLFCSQGLFMQCQPDSCGPVHLFHERCCGIHEGEARCPHCGSLAQWKPVRLRISSARAPTFFMKQQSLPKQPSARMTISRGQDALLEGWDVVPPKSYKLPDVGREISSAGLPIGPDRTQLESLLMNLSLERPMNLRYTIKSLYNAAKSGDVEKILQMLAMGFDPNHRFEEHDNEAALHAACAAGHLVAVHVLQQAGAYLDCLDNHLRTPLMAAIDNGQIVLVQYLVRAGVHLEARGEDGMTVLHVAAKSGNLEACRLLLDTGKINVNIQDDGGWTPLVWGAEFRHKDIVRFLLRSGSDPNVRDNEQNVSLHWASFSGCLEICELLLNAGCDLGSVNEHGDTPLHIAARQDNYECIILFLARNADITAQNKEDETPIMCCPDKSSQTWMALSMNSQLKQFAQMRSSRSELILHRDVSYGKEANPIQCINGVDLESFPVDYLYVIENCETSPIHLNRSIISLQSCSCCDDCAASTCTCASLSLKCWFTSDGGLIPEFNLLDPPMIFECNRACRCWQNCRNRVVQHGITCRLQLFRTKGKGWGVRTLRDIPRGTFICEYIGEVISDSEADQREDDSYLFDLDNRDGETYCIDARHYGNISRFVNHLCEPNLVPVKVFVDHHDLRFPRIAFFSSRDIKAYEELGFDYGEKFWIIKYKTFTCMCASERCKYSADKIQEMLDSYSRRQREEVES